MVSTRSPRLPYTERGWGPSSNGTKTWCFRVVPGQLELLNCISRVSEGSGLTALHRLGQAEVIAPVHVDELVHQWGKTLDVLGVGSPASGRSVAPAQS